MSDTAICAPLLHLQAEAKFGLFGASFLVASGRAYSEPLLEHGYGIGAPQACYINALTLALQHPDSLFYCEGRATAHSLPIEHAWCVTRDGHVIDTTWRAEILQGALYFGTCFDSTWLSARMEAQQHPAVLADFFPEDLLHQDPALFLACPSASLLSATRQFQADAVRALTALRA